MDELNWGIVILSALAIAGLAAVLGIFSCVALLVSKLVRWMRPQCSARLTALIGSSLIPVFTLLLFLFAFSTALEPDFRGPEVLGIAIVGIVAMFSLLVGWPVSYFVAHRAMARR